MPHVYSYDKISKDESFMNNFLNIKTCLYIVCSIAVYCAFLDYLI